MQYLLSLPDVNVAITVPTDPESEERERTALHIAAAHNSLNIVKLLIDKKHPLTIKDKNVRVKKYLSSQSTVLHSGSSHAV